jgi:hypothetical protein
MVEHGAAGLPLATPFPLARRWVRVAVAVVGVALIVAMPTRYLVWILLATLVAVALLPRILVRTPYPAFLTLGREQAYTLEPQTWVRLPEGYAVQVMNVHIRTPDTVGDPTPPEVLIRCSDGATRRYRPHDVVHVVQPVDLR